MLLKGLAHPSTFCYAALSQIVDSSPCLELEPNNTYILPVLADLSQVFGSPGMSTFILDVADPPLSISVPVQGSIYVHDSK